MWGLAHLTLTYIPKQKCQGNNRTDDRREHQSSQQPFRWAHCSHYSVRVAVCRMLACSFTRTTEHVLNHDIASVTTVMAGLVQQSQE